MNKLILGLVIGASLAVGLSSYAAFTNFNGRWFDNGNGGPVSGYVDKFVDGGVNCYVVVNNNAYGAISCVKVK